MENQIQLFRWTRKNIDNLLDGISFEKAVKIPSGFSNNIMWNAGHIHVIQQFLTYKLTGYPMDLDNEFFKSYVTGSKPKDHIEKDEFEFIKTRLKTSVDNTIDDYMNNKFTSYKSFSGKYGVVEYTFKTFEESFQYNNLHEVLHLGYMNAMMKALG